MADLQLKKIMKKSLNMTASVSYSLMLFMNPIKLNKWTIDKVELYVYKW